MNIADLVATGLFEVEETVSPLKKEEKSGRENHRFPPEFYSYFEFADAAA